MNQPPHELRNVWSEVRPWIPALALLFIPATIAAQESPTIGEVIRANLGLGSGEVREGGTRRVWVRNARGAPVVAKVHVEVGSKFVLWMPDGRLAAVDSADAQLTTQAFSAVSREELIAQVKQELKADFSVVETRRHLYFYNCSSGFQKQAAEIVETILDGVYQHFLGLGFTVYEPKVPLVVIIFRTQKEFSEFGEVGDKINGYYDLMTNYVVLFEKSELNIVGSTLASDEVLSAVAHESVHQTLSNIGVQPRLAIWPMWVSEGLAEFFAPTTEGSPVRWKGLGQVNDLRMASLESYFQSQKRPDGAMVRNTLAARRLDSDGYARAWALVHYLHDRKPVTLLEYIRKLSVRIPMEVPKPNKENGRLWETELEEFATYFGGNYANLETGLVHHLRSQKFVHPLANAAHHVAMIEYRQGQVLTRMTSLSVLPEDSTKWRDETWAKLNATQRSTLRYYVKKLPNRRDADRYAYRWLRGSL